MGPPISRAGDTISKYIWLREQRPEIWSQTAKLLDVKDYLLLRTTGRTVTTYDLASGGWLFKTKRGDLGWSDRILKMLNFDAKRLPTVLRSTEVAGPLQEDAAADLGIPAGTPVIAGAGDVPSCAVGSGAVRNEEVHICLGTSSWVAAHRDNRCVDPFSATGTLCAAEFGQYILIATQETAGASMEWLRQNLLGSDLDYPEINRLIQNSPPGAGGIHFFPWMMGERVPMDDSSVRGGFINLSLDNTQADMLRSVLEGVAFNTRWAFEVVQKLPRFPCAQRADHRRWCAKRSLVPDHGRCARTTRSPRDQPAILWRPRSRVDRTARPRRDFQSRRDGRVSGGP